MARKGINVTLTGFDELLSKIEKADGNIDEAVKKAVNAGASTAEQELRGQASASGVPGHLVGQVGKEVKHYGNTYRVKVGWKLGEYNPRNLSDGFKVLFLNYGTPHRQLRGQIAARGFIARAKKKAKPKIKKAQEEALRSILSDLEG